eukprot:TRINITY_DN4269_c0_g1_i3.p1 TRINITY_DN4269_c0_g1~~TRINITY_DN4269_c0_g1_i3.p1  ORF type:complete len:678 (-),score=106.91 TRINITY_DN4269_c0_g1_i3:42-2075(-)
MSCGDADTNFEPPSRVVELLREVEEEYLREVNALKDKNSLLRERLVDVGSGLRASSDDCIFSAGRLVETTPCDDVNAPHGSVAIEMATSQKPLDAGLLEDSPVDEGDQPINVSFTVLDSWINSWSGQTLSTLFSTRLQNHSESLPWSEPMPTWKSAKIMGSLFVPGRWLLNPSSHWRPYWDGLCLPFLAWDFFFLPLQAFNIEYTTFFELMDLIILLFWTVDLIITLNLAYFRDGEIILERCQILKRYAKTWLAVDLIVLLPDWLRYGVLLASPGTDNASNAFKLMGLTRLLRSVRAMRILRFLRLLKLRRLWNAMYDIIDSENMFLVMNLAKLLICILVLNHAISCVWFLVGYYTMQRGLDNWLQHSGRVPTDNLSIAEQYITSLHWSMTQFTPASMDVSAVNVFERAFSIIVLFFAMISFASIVGSVTASITSLRSIKGNLVRQFWLLRRYLKQNKVSAHVSERILRYLEETERRKTTFNHDIVSPSKIPLLKELTLPLLAELNAELHIRLVVQHPVFDRICTDSRPLFLRTCDATLSTATFGPKDCVFHNGDEAASMYFIKSGEFSYEPRVRMKTLTMSGGWISEMPLWTTWVHLGSFTAFDHAELVIVNANRFVQGMCKNRSGCIIGRPYAQMMVQVLNEQPRFKLSDITPKHKLMHEWWSKSEVLESAAGDG